MKITEYDQNKAEYLKKNPFLFSLLVIVWVTWMGSSLFLITGNGLSFTFGVISLGFALVHGVELQHQALHFSGFKSKKANTFWGYLMGAGMLVSFLEYRKQHMHHHAKVGTEEDQEFFNFDSSESFDFEKFIFLFFMVEHYRKYLKYSFINNDSIPEMFKNDVKEFRLFYLAINLGLLALIVGCLTTGNAGFMLGYFISLFFVASPLHFLVEMLEHIGCSTDSPDVFKNTRTIYAGPIITWFTNGNNFHVEHHLKPSVPMHRIRRLHMLVRTDIQNFNYGYFEFYTSMFKKYSKGPGEIEDAVT